MTFVFLISRALCNFQGLGGETRSGTRLGQTNNPTLHRQKLARPGWGTRIYFLRSAMAARTQANGWLGWATTY